MIVDKIRGKKSVISVMKIIEQITEIYDDAQVLSIGEPEVLVEYDDNSKNKILQALKVAAVCILIFFGSAFTIMAFNNDISISGVFEHFYKQIMGVDKPQVSVLEVFSAVLRVYTPEFFLLRYQYAPAFSCSLRLIFICI